MKIFIINQYAGNKGDRAVAFMEMRELLQSPRVDKIYLSTSVPSSWDEEDIIHNPKVEIVPWCWNVDGFNPRNRKDWEYRRLMQKIILPLTARLYIKGKRLPMAILKLVGSRSFIHTLKDADVVVSTGGHHLTTRFTPNMQNELLFDMLISSMYGKKFILWSQTFGPFSFTNSTFKKACEKLLNTSTVISRDESSINAIKGLAPNAHVLRTYETVMGLNNELTHYIAPSKRPKRVGITVYNAEARNNKEYEKYLSVMAMTTEYLMELGYEVIFFPHERIGAVVNDRKCIADILKLVKNPNGITIHDDAPTKTHLKHLSECQFFIGHKTHSIVFALTMATPLIAISYHPKTSDFMKQFEVSENLIDDQKLSFENMKLKIDNLISHLDQVGEIQYRNSQKYGEIVRRDFASYITKS